MSTSSASTSRRRPRFHLQAVDRRRPWGETRLIFHLRSDLRRRSSCSSASPTGPGGSSSSPRRKGQAARARLDRHRASGPRGAAQGLFRRPRARVARAEPRAGPPTDRRSEAPSCLSSQRPHAFHAGGEEGARALPEGGDRPRAQLHRHRAPRPRHRARGNGLGARLPQRPAGRAHRRAPARVEASEKEKPRTVPGPVSISAFTTTRATAEAVPPGRTSRSAPLVAQLGDTPSRGAGSAPRPVPMRSSRVTRLSCSARAADGRWACSLRRSSCR